MRSKVLTLICFVGGLGNLAFYLWDGHSKHSLFLAVFGIATALLTKE